MRNEGTIVIEGQPPNFAYEAFKSGIGYLVVFVLGAVIAALRIENRFRTFEKEVVDPLRREIETLEKESNARLEKAVGQMRVDMKEWQGEMKELLKVMDGKIDKIREQRP